MNHYLRNVFVAERTMDWEKSFPIYDNKAPYVVVAIFSVVANLVDHPPGFARR